MISIIVPVYKTKKYLDKCVQSLIEQTYTDIEIILVDDGSPDECGKMCDDWAKKDARITVVHRENGGLSAARNSGLKAAKGEYVAFIDSDDYVAKDMFKALFNAAQKHEADVVECGYISVGENETTNAIEDDGFFVYTAEEAMKEIMLERNLHQVVWNKLYSKNALKDLIFAEGKINEDEFFTYKAIGNSKRVVSLKSKYYFYVQHEGSIMSSGYSIKRLDAIDALEERMYYINEHFPKLSDIAKMSYLSACFYAHQCLTRNREIDKNKKHRNELVKRVRKEKVSNKVISMMGGKTPIFFRMFRIFPNFTSALRNKLGVGL